MKYRWFFIYLFFFLVFVGGCKKKRDLAKIDYLKNLQSISDDSVFLIISGSVEGYVESCGCTSKPLGDIARFAQVFEDIKSISKNPPILINSGNLLFDTESRNDADLCQDNARIELLLSTLSSLGLKYTISGPLDNARGQKFRDDWYKKMGIEALNKEHDSKIINTPSGNILLVGINSDAKKDDIIAAIERIKRDHAISLVVAISQMSRERLSQNFKDFRGIDVIILGQTQDVIPKNPERLGALGPILVEGGWQNQYFTFLLIQNLKKHGSNAIILDQRSIKQSSEIELLRSRIISLKSQIESAPKARQDFLKQRIEIAAKELKQINIEKERLEPYKETNIRFEAIPLSKDVDPLPRVNEKLEKYRKSVPSLVANCEENLECAPPPAGEAIYVGVESCKGCHAQAVEVWKKAVYWGEGQDESGKMVKRLMGHSKAFDTLVQVHKEMDRACIGCHSVGFMKSGGFCKVSDVGFRKEVQCESCHGPGSIHAQSGNKKAIKNPTEETCRGCHHVPHIQSFESFNYTESLKKILGPGHGERLLKELNHKAKI